MGANRCGWLSSGWTEFRPGRRYFSKALSRRLSPPLKKVRGAVEEGLKSLVVVSGDSAQVAIGLRFPVGMLGID